MMMVDGIWMMMYIKDQGWKAHSYLLISCRSRWILLFIEHSSPCPCPWPICVKLALIRSVSLALAGLRKDIERESSGGRQETEWLFITSILR